MGLFTGLTERMNLGALIEPQNAKAADVAALISGQLSYLTMQCRPDHDRVALNGLTSLLRFSSRLAPLGPALSEVSLKHRA